MVLYKGNEIKIQGNILSLWGLSINGQELPTMFRYDFDAIEFAQRYIDENLI